MNFFKQAERWSLGALHQLLQAAAAAAAVQASRLSHTAEEEADKQSPRLAVERRTRLEEAADMVYRHIQAGH